MFGLEQHRPVASKQSIQSPRSIHSLYLRMFNPFTDTQRPRDSSAMQRVFIHDEHYDQLLFHDQLIPRNMHFIGVGNNVSLEDPDLDIRAGTYCFENIKLKAPWFRITDTDLTLKMCAAWHHLIALCWWTLLGGKQMVFPSNPALRLNLPSDSFSDLTVLLESLS